MPTIINGKDVAEKMRNEFASRIDALKQKGHIPGLAVVLVGDDPASQVYVNMKGRACEKAGIYSKTIKLDIDTNKEELLSVINELNNDDQIDGILVQHPIGNIKDESTIFNAINPEKDVDCFNAVNVGKLVTGEGYLFPCTPAGVLELLKRYGIDPKGQHTVIIGRSNIVGKPLANMLVQKKQGCNSIVTVVHTAASDISKYTKEADILIAAVGRTSCIKAEMIKPGAVVIDVGVNRVEDDSKPKGYRLEGDVDFENCSKKASYITPVPGGVGPMTIAMLLSNTITSAEKRFA